MPDVKTFLASTDIDGLIAKAKAQPAKPLIIQKIVGTGAYSVNLEYRAGAAAPASIHDNENELMVFVQGTAPSPLAAPWWTAPAAIPPTSLAPASAAARPSMWPRATP